jgi:hypothetical protein
LIRGGRLARVFHRLDHAASDHDCIGHLRDGPCAGGVLDAESDTHRQAYTCSNRRYPLGHGRDVQVTGPRDAGQAHVVHVSAGDTGDLVDPSFGGGRRQQEDRVDCAHPQALGKLGAFLGRVIDDQHAVDARIRRELHKAIGSHPLDRVRVPHQHDRSGLIAAAKISDELQTLLQTHPLADRAVRSPLDHRPIGHRVGKRHAQLDHVGPGPCQRVHQRHRALRRGVAARHVRNQPGATLGAQLLEALADARHQRFPR